MMYLISRDFLCVNQFILIYSIGKSRSTPMQYPPVPDRFVPDRFVPDPFWLPFHPDCKGGVEKRHLYHTLVVTPPRDPKRSEGSA